MRRLFSSWKTILLILSLCFFTNAFAKQTLTTETRNVKGQGDTLNLAISNALIQGVSEINGTYVNSVNAIINEKLTAKGNVTVDQTQTPVHVDLLAQENISAVKTATHGVILNYQLLNQEEKNNTYFVTLQITFAKYQKIDSKKEDKRYSLAVLPFQLITTQGATNQISYLLNQALMTKLSQSKKFRIVDRNNLDLSEYQKEVHILASGNVNNLDKARLGQLIGADYLLVGTINQFKVTDKTREFYGAKFDHYIATATINVRLLEMATMEIHDADTITVTIPEAEINEILQDPDNDAQTIRDLLINKLASAISRKILQYNQN